MFKNLDKDFSLPKLDQEIAKLWKQEGTFQQVREARAEAPPFVFYEGPPTANGKPGIHHVLGRSAKDTICRFKTMQGYSVPRKAGWDTHGLPVERGIEDKLGIRGRRQIMEHGIAAFNDACRDSVFSFKDHWDRLTEQMGYWIDLEDPYITLDNKYIESVWWILKQFHDKDLIYKGFRVVPYCPDCETPLSSHETAQGYKDITDPSVYVTMPVQGQDYDLLVWTTTPWTLVSNVAVAVGPEIDYVKVKVPSRERPLVLAQNLTSCLTEDHEVLENLKGQDLLGLEYTPLFTFLNPDKPCFRIVSGDFVSTEDGTGLVHMAPAFGDDDYKVSQKEDLPILNPIDERGKFTSVIPDLEGKFFKEADPDVITLLKRAGRLYRSQKIKHSYPHCWRCDVPLIYYARDAWYIRMTDLKDQLIQANERVNWYPEATGKGRFGQWLENLQDWSLSRDRFWGTPLNIWVCESCNHETSVGSQEELKKLSGQSEDCELHRPIVDDLEFDCPKCSGKMKRTPEVIDCWFDSGSMPFAQHHYPFENQDLFETQFPADYICEAVDQTRGWFYSLLAISVFIKGEAPYRNVLVNDLILDENGEKMSKRKGNIVDPFELMDKYGSDVIRWYLLTTNSIWLPIRFKADSVAEVKRKFFDTLINTYKFFSQYANIDEFNLESERPEVQDRPLMDRWLLSRTNSVVSEVIQTLEQYDITQAMNKLSEFFIEEVSNWYVRLNRRRFWKSGESADKNAAYCTLQEVLIVTSRLMAPVAPFVSDFLHRELSGAGSVHLALMPEPDPALSFKDIEEAMANTRTVVELGRNLRTQHNLKVRQPLGSMMVQTTGDVYEDLILTELNVKTFQKVGLEEDLVKKKLKANFKKLGPVFGKKVPLVVKAIQAAQGAELEKAVQGQVFEIEVDGEKVEVQPEWVEIAVDQLEGLVAQGDGSITVALKTEITPELQRDGWAREFVNRAQNMRKDMGLEVTDRILIQVSTNEDLHKALEEHRESVEYELLGQLELLQQEEQPSSEAFVKETDIEGLQALVGISKS